MFMLFFVMVLCGRLCLYFIFGSSFVSVSRLGLDVDGFFVV